MNGKILLICFVFAIAGIMIASIIYSTAANAKSKSVITSKMCVNGECEVRTSDSNSSSLSISDAGEVSGGAPDIKAKPKKEFSEPFFGDKFGDAWENLMAEHNMSSLDLSIK
jgi:hypothetical protein